MSNFKGFAKAVNVVYESMLEADNHKNTSLFIVEATGDELWDKYLSSFPEGSNPMFRERTEHDCSTCRNFVKNIGGLIHIGSSGRVTSVWDVSVSDPAYAVVAKAMSDFVKSKKIQKPFYVGESRYGAERTIDFVESWHHFFAVVPRAYVVKFAVTNVVGNRTEDANVFRRSLDEISAEAGEVVMELIDQNSIYRGAEFKNIVKTFLAKKRQYDVLKTAKEKDIFVWREAAVLGGGARIRNTVIGTLLVDIADGVNIDKAVASFESKVAPANYKRPAAVVTQKMIDSAYAKVQELDIEESLHRRYAVRSDIAVNDVLFVNGSVRPLLIGSVFDDIKPTKKASAKFGKVEDVCVGDFISKILPTASSVELYLKNEFRGNFVSLIAPAVADSKPLFKWDNGFSWSYDGDVTDSIKERVKNAGGKVDGYLRVSLSWHNSDDLDLSVEQVYTGKTVFFAKRQDFGAELDVDMNAYGKYDEVAPVENIVWATKKSVADGEYVVRVNNFNKRSSKNVGYEVEIEVDGKVYSFANTLGLSGGKTEVAGRIVVERGEVRVIGMNGCSVSSEKWGVSTEQWVPVDMIMKSPNCWGGEVVGNEHLFFMLKDCRNPDDSRGFYNEFLRNDLNEHRKVFELLASKLRAPYNEDQLSGVGFSSTKKETVTVKVVGSTTRVINVVF